MILLDIYSKDGSIREAWQSDMYSEWSITLRRASDEEMEEEQDKYTLKMMVLMLMIWHVALSWL